MTEIAFLRVGWLEARFLESYEIFVSVKLTQFCTNARQGLVLDQAIALRFLLRAFQSRGLKIVTMFICQKPKKNSQKNH